MRVTFRKTVIFGLCIGACLAATWRLMLMSSGLHGEKNTLDVSTKDHWTSKDQSTINVMSQEKVLEEFLPHLRQLVKDLIDIKMILSGEEATLIAQKYDYFQSILLRLESYAATLNIGRDNNEKTDAATSNKQGALSAVACPDYFKGKSYGYPFFRVGFVRKECKKKPLSESITFILDRPLPSSIQHIIKSIYDLYGNPIVHILLQSSNTHHAQPLRDSTWLHTIDHRSNIGNVLNNITAKATTKYILILPHLTAFDNNSDVERMLHVLTITDAMLVGGAVLETSTGIWRRPGQLLTLKNYTLALRRGYRKSIQECMFCEYLEGPFLASKAFLVKHSFDDNLKSGFYLDFFLRLYKSKEKLLACPDIMFKWMRHEAKDAELVPFVKKWDIKRMLDSEGRERWFGCRRNVAHKESKCKVRTGMAVPPCCLQNLADAIKFLFRVCGDYNLTCELQEGTLLGAVKFEKVLPWERDADLTVLSSDVNKLASMEDMFTKEGYDLRVTDQPTCCFENRITGGTLNIEADGWNLQIYGQHRMDSERNDSGSTPPTKLLFDGVYVNVPENPGQFARHRYGKEIYQHVEHWSEIAIMDTGWYPYSPGKFLECSLKGHHGCLDHYQADGDLQFRNP